jgi:hypothetical protein
MTDQQGDELAEEGEEQLDEFAPLAAAIGGAIGRAAVGATASTIERGLAGMAGSAVGSKVAGMLDSDDEDYMDESRCNMSEAGEECSVHGMEECWGATAPAVPVAKELDPMLSRMKTLAGFMVK